MATRTERNRSYREVCRAMGLCFECPRKRALPAIAGGRCRAHADTANARAASSVRLADDRVPTFEDFERMGGR